MLIFCFFLAVLYLVAVLAVTLPYWYEVGNNPSEDIPSSPWAPRPVIKLWLEAAWNALLLGVAFPADPILRRIRNKRAVEDADNLPPVLLVHGLYHNPSGWMFLRGHLHKAGFRKVHTLKYSTWKTDISAITGKLDAAITELESRYPGEKPLLVGHSLGGLLIRNWLAAKKNQTRARGAVTLGAPHRGSKMAALAFGKLGRSLSPANPFFDDLARTENAAGIPCISLVSEADTMVLPQHCLVPPTKGWEMRLTPYTTHAGLMVKGSVCRMVVWELHRITSMAEPEKTPEPEPASSPEQAPEAAPKPVTVPNIVAVSKPAADAPKEAAPKGERPPVKTTVAKSSAAKAKPATKPAPAKSAVKKTPGTKKKTSKK